MAHKKPHKGQELPSVGAKHKRLKMKKEHKRFLEDRYPQFLKEKAKRGTSKRRNAKAWARTKLIKEFVSQFYADEDSDGRKEVSAFMKEVRPPSHCVVRFRLFRCVNQLKFDLIVHPLSTHRKFIRFTITSTETTQTETSMRTRTRGR